MYLQNSIVRIRVSEPASFEVLDQSGFVPVDRYGHTAIMLNHNNTMLVYGGYAGEMNLLNDLNQYSFEHRKWRRIEFEGAQPTPCDGQSAVWFNNGLYVYGGRNLMMQRVGDLHRASLENDGEWSEPAAEAVSVWACPVCTLENHGVDVCGVCGHERMLPNGGALQGGPADGYYPEDDDDDGPPPEVWVDAQRIQQLLASLPERFTEPPMQRAPEGPWPCPECTFINTVDDTYCQMCSAAYE
eukprot:TRINITY_DN53_c0_g1_i6.p1 TRINITY_DN53_c0_g1~~TRINITY_DN53_c0_g1_i6.p1  ORF type:complete len:266 (+),score=106.28 TRINITY_DN53_c0_g1_i6:74-799(+)